jgi:hypothetical protein
VASAAESEAGAYFLTAESRELVWVTLLELGHKQPYQRPPPLRTDNSAALRILNETIKQKRSKAMDMHAISLANRQSKPKTKQIKHQLFQLRLRNAHLFQPKQTER